MKKKIFLLISVCFLAFGFAYSNFTEKDTIYKYSIKIEKDYSKDKITSIQKELESSNIHLKFSKLIYNKNGKIIEIEGTVKSFFNSGSFYSDDFYELIISAKPGISIEIY